MYELTTIGLFVVLLFQTQTQHKIVLLRTTRKFIFQMNQNPAAENSINCGPIYWNNSHSLWQACC